MLKWTLRIASGSLLLLLILLTGAITSFYSWRSEIIRSIEDDPDRLIASTSKGDIEYAVIGKGLPILMLHGGPGGYDQSLISARSAPEQSLPGTMTIAVSRPGYLGTPLNSGITYQDQADLFAALLDQLSIDRVVVIASSAGGRAGLQFALRHPDRTIGLVLRSARIVPRADSRAEPEQSSSEMLFQDFAMWALRFTPSSWIEDYDKTDPSQVDRIERMVASIVPTKDRVLGGRNDGVQYATSAIENWNLDKLTVPTLVMHGDIDPLVPYSDAQLAAGSIPNASLVTIEGGDHFMYITQVETVSAYIREFITQLNL